MKKEGKRQKGRCERRKSKKDGKSVREIDKVRKTYPSPIQNSVLPIKRMRREEEDQEVRSKNYKIKLKKSKIHKKSSLVVF